jgi:hypothetical protein
MRPFNRRFEYLKRITNVVDDWLTPVEFLPYIDALLGDIDLDPCSTARANKEFLRAKKIFTYEDDGLNTDIPWTGKTYLFPPTYGRCSFSKPRGTWRWSLKAGAGAKAPAAVWFSRLEREWKLRNIPEALFYTTSHEIMRTCPQIWDYPMCIPKKRAELIHGRIFERTVAFTWGFFVYLPRSEFGFKQVDDFTRIFSHLGKILH